jgi:cytochrome c oxidase assembly protein subunit 15
MMKLLCLGAAIMTWPLIPFGAYVRLKNAGLSCPDWPLCYGQLLPPEGFEIALEVGHRFIATFLGVLIIAITFVTFLQPTYFKQRKIAVTSLILVCVQGILGALTVTMVLWPPIVTLHLLGGNILFGILVYMTRVTFKQTDEITSKSVGDYELFSSKTKVPLQRQLIWMLAVLLIMITSGGYNSTTSSGTHCEAFPGCHEGSVVSFGMSGIDISGLSGIEGDVLAPAPPEFHGRFLPFFANELIHMLHRLIALIGGLVLMLMSWFWLKNSQGFHVHGISIIILILLEICVGILNAVLRVPVPVSTLHTAIAATLTGLLFYVLADIHLKKDKL